MATQTDDTNEDTSTKEDRLTLVVKIEVKKLQYKRERRPLAWYGIIASIALVGSLTGIVFVGILGNSTYFGSFALTVAIVSGVIYCLLFIGFFSYKGFDS